MAEEFYPKSFSDIKKPGSPEPAVPEKIEIIDEKKELLKREEISTMEKDVARLREIEARKERERISSLKTEEAQVEDTAMKAPKEEKVEEPGLLIPKPIKRVSSLLKIGIRAGVVVIVLALGFSLYWFLSADKPEEGPEETVPETNATTTEPEEEPIQEEPVEEIPVGGKITDRILSWGFYIPTKARTVDTIIIHSAYNAIGGDVYSTDKVIEEFRAYKVTPHYLIERNGNVLRLAPDEAVAYHAGTSLMPDGTRKNIVNIFSIGIELIYNKTDSPEEAQYEALADLIKSLRGKYEIPLENVLGHKDVSEDKTDPWNFNWEHLSSLLE